MLKTPSGALVDPPPNALSRSLAHHVAVWNVPPAPGGAQNGSLPLHIAVGIQGADAVVEALLDAYPKGAETRDSVRVIARMPDPSIPTLPHRVVGHQLALCGVVLATYPRGLCPC